MPYTSSSCQRLVLRTAMRRFSSTVSRRKIPRFSGTSARPWRAISKIFCPTSAWPLKWIWPWRGQMMPRMLRRVVVLPAPLRPSRVTSSPGLTLSDTPSSTWLLS